MTYFDKEEFYKWMAILILISTGVFALFLYLNQHYQHYQKVRYDYQNRINQNLNWKTYKNDKYGFELLYPSNWNAGISSIFPNVVLFCPYELSSLDPDVICKLKENAGHADSRAPIIFNLIQKNLQLAENDTKYVMIFEQMKNSLKFTQ